MHSLWEIKLNICIYNISATYYLPLYREAHTTTLHSSEIGLIRIGVSTKKSKLKLYNKSSRKFHMELLNGMEKNEKRRVGVFYLSTWKEMACLENEWNERNVILEWIKVNERKVG